MDLIFFLFWTSLCLYLAWWHGHKSIWGKLHYKHSIPDFLGMELIDPGFVGFVNIDILQNAKREEGWGVNIFLDKRGVLFKSVKYFRYFMPSIFIPWQVISSIEENVPQGYLGQKKTKLVLLGAENAAILIPSGNYTESIKTFIHNHDIKFNR